METVQLQCGSCNKLMAISTQHLGGQVRCPHCQSVVQTPPRPQPAAVSAPEEIHAPRVEAGEVESIFSPPPPTEDLFDAGPPRSLVEMPPAPQETVTLDTPRPLFQDNPEAPAEAAAPPSDEPDLTAVDRPRAPVDRGYWSLMLLIFLVPYSLLMTLFVAYLWYQLANQTTGLDLLPDPQPKKDGARPAQRERAKHDMPLAPGLKVALGGTIRIGEIEVKPQQVRRGEFGDLELVLNARNVSADQAFNPLSPEFLKTGKGIAPPYTFVETKVFQPLYGGHLGFDRGGDGQTIDGDLQPGQAENIVITTRDNKDVVKRILESNEDVTWRVQVRRGLVPARGGKVSATAVIGVTFKPKDVVQGG